MKVDEQSPGSKPSNVEPGGEKDAAEDDPTVEFTNKDGAVKEPWLTILKNADLLKDNAVTVDGKVYSSALPQFIKITPDTNPSTGPLSFSSSQNKVDFGNEASEVPDCYKGVLMGLDSSKMPGDYALSDILTAFNISHTRGVTTNLGPVGSILNFVNGFEGKTKEKMGRLAILADSGLENYNGLWIIPQKKEKKEDSDVLEESSIILAESQRLNRPSLLSN